MLIPLFVTQSTKLRLTLILPLILVSWSFDFKMRNYLVEQIMYLLELYT